MTTYVKFQCTTAYSGFILILMPPVLRPEHFSVSFRVMLGWFYGGNLGWGLELGEGDAMKGWFETKSLISLFQTTYLSQILLSSK